MSEWNPQPPIANNVRIMKYENEEYIPVDIITNSYERLYGFWEYEDSNCDPPGNSIYRWYRSSTNDPNGFYEIINDTDGNPHDENTYIPTDYDIGKYILFEVTPVQLLLLNKIVTEQIITTSSGILIDLVTT